MARAALLLFALASTLSAAEPTLAEVRTGLAQLSVDPDQTYRVRDLQFSRGGVKLYLTEGILAFAKPIFGHRLAAVFTTQMVDAGDAELLTFPPNRAERASLASFTGSPNLDEHFKSALLFFGDDTARELLAQIQNRPVHAAPEGVARLAEAGDSALQANANLIDVRLAAAVLDQHRPEHGFFYAIIGGRDKGSFIFAFQPDEPDSVTFGRMAPTASADESYLQIWAAFQPRGVPGTPTPTALATDYQIETTIHPDLGMEADARFDFLTPEGGGRVISMLITPRLQVLSATVDGQPAEVFQHASPLSRNQGGVAPFLIVAPSAMAAGSHHQVTLKYAGILIHKTARGTYFVDDRNAWYPFLNPVRANFDLIFHCPEALSLAATGEPVSEEVMNGVRTVHRRTSSPRVLAGFNIGEYTASSSSHGPYRIEVYSNRANPASADVPAQTAAILDHYTSLWGPLPIHNLAVSPIEGYFGQGFPGLIYLSDISYTLEQDRPPALRNPRLDSFFSQVLLPHEIAHQWWGNIVAPADYRANWILEALAHYVALQYLEASRGHAVFEEVLSTFRMELVASKDGRMVDSRGPVVFGERLLDNYGGGIWHDIVYEKGAWIFHMLRQRLGDAGFLELQRRLLRDYSVKPIANEDLRREASALLPPDAIDRSLNGFFETWVYGTGIPTLNLAGRELTMSGLDEDYLADVPLTCKIDGKLVTRWIHASVGSNVVPLSSCERPFPTRFLFH